MKNEKTGKVTPMIAESVYKVIMDNADVSYVHV